jgi:molecular chaperone GrpE
MSMTEDKDKIKNDPEAKDSHLNDDKAEEVRSEVEGEESTINEDEKNVKENDGTDEVIDMKGLFKNKKEMVTTIKKLENENEALRERLARISAEYDNFRKRTQKEKEGIYSDSIVEVVKEILPAIDNLEASLKVEASDVESVKKGVSMTLSQFSDAFSKLKVAEIDTDMAFDPNFHDAVMHVDDPAFNEKEITQVFLKGYQREDKIIRYSVVKVAN